MLKMTEKQIIKKWFSNDKYYNSSIIMNHKDENGHTVDIAFVYSGRNRGKSFNISALALWDAWKTQGQVQFGYARRLEKEMKLTNIESYFEDKKEFIKDISNNRADGVLVRSDGIYFSKESKTENKVVKEPLFLIGKFFAITNAEQYKSLQYPRITRLIFEEVFTNGRYVSNEVDNVLSIISTIQRGRDNFTAFLISNTISRINPYVQGLGLKNMTKQKQGTIDFYKLYKATYDEKGNEQYYYIACEYLKDNDNAINKKFLDKNRNRLTSVSSNDWQELKQYVNVSNKYMSQFFTDKKVVFEWDSDRFLCTICSVPYNIEETITGFKNNDDTVKEDSQCFNILYVERKTSIILNNTRCYTNNHRVNPLITKGFKKIYSIDDVVSQLIMNGWYVFADNLTGNEFIQILKELY